MDPTERADARLNVTALGGGHGLFASLSALRHVATDLTAVVTVADNGGSSGRLREEFDCLPPGDLRMALAALCGDDDWGQTWARVLQHRFSSVGSLDQHAVGNLLIVALWQILDDDPQLGLDWVGRLLGAQGRVVPMSAVPLDIEADVNGLDPASPTSQVVVRGQVEVASTRGQVVQIRLDPADPPASPQAVKAIEESDWVVLGPGSWFTSVIPNLLVPGLREALLRTSARKLVTLNLEPQPGETEGFSPETHLEVLAQHAPGFGEDVVVLADVAAVVDRDRLQALVTSVGSDLVVADVAVGDGTGRHDPVKLAAAYAHIMQAT